MIPPRIQPALHYSFAFTALVYLFAAKAVAVLGADDKPAAANRRRRIHLAVFVLIVATYLANTVVCATQADILGDGEARLVQLIILAFVWTWIALRPSSPAYIPFGSAIISAAFEIPFLVFAFLDGSKSASEITDVSFQCTRLLLLLVVVAIGIGSSHASLDHEDTNSPEPAYRDEVDEASNSESTAASDDDDYDSDEAEDAASIKRRRAQRLKETGGWLAYVKDFSIFLPFLIPKRDRKVQLCFAATFGCIVANRVLNILIPRQVAIITDQTISGHAAPYGALAVWLGLTLLDEFRGVGLVQHLVKIPIQQFAQRKITNAAFNHVMTLSMDFHSDRDSAEVMKAIEQGTSLNSILEIVAIELFPMTFDIVFAMGIFWWKFNAFVPLVMFISAAVFISIEASMLKKNMRNKRQASKTEREESRVMHQAVQGWQTVTYFNMFGFEKRRYAKAVEDHLDANKKSEIMDAISETILDSVDPITFFMLACLVLYEVSQGRATTGDFIFTIQYWSYLFWPIRLLSENSKLIFGHLVDAERLLALLQTKPTVADKEGAIDLGHIEGRVSYENVGFYYDERKPTIQGLSLSASQGETIAFVGATGAGKSTTAKLLLRFYDVKSGRITVDGHDIRDVTLSSLRTSIGVVPQDPLLFNSTILENLRYARPEATDEEVFEACRKAAIHDKITTFADGYETKVGEQGVKLSGGEIQRLAIARVFLKDPPILILDEATSAIDTETEHKIQQALDVLKKGRTTFVIAHRLSTIVGADKIMVISDGHVIESGTHSELLEIDGSYKSLWSKQSGGTLVDV
jgi:ABC-type multidrug transport system fused ATPase/permease subunit